MHDFSLPELMMLLDARLSRQPKTEKEKEEAKKDGTIQDLKVFFK